MDILIKEFVKLLLKTAQAGIVKLAKGPLEEFKLRNKLSESVAETLAAIQPFLDSEGIVLEKQEFLLNQCLLELKPLLKKPEEFLRGSLDGQSLYRRLYGKSGPPQAIHEEQLDIPFRLIFPKIADRFNAYLPLTEQGKALGLGETLRRFDEVNINLAKVAAEFREYTQRDLEYGDENFHILHGIVLDAALGRLAVTGLLGKYRYEITLDDIFVLPALESVDKRKVDILENIADNSRVLFTPGARILVEGQPGAGKTTWTCWLQSMALKRSPRLIGVRLRFRDYPDGKLPSYYDLIRASADPNLRARLKDVQIDQWISDGRIIFLLDGFDEVSPRYRKQVRLWLDGLHRTCLKAPIILTSRPLSTEHLKKLHKTWQRWNMRSFDKSRVELYINRWYRHHPHLASECRCVDSTALAKQWHDDPSLSELTGNPLMLGTLLTVHQHEGKSLPRGRAKLYERYIEGMLGPWEQNIPVRRDLELTEDQKLGLLKGIAYSMLLSEVDALSEDDDGELKGMHSVVASLIEPLQIKAPDDHDGELAPLVLSELRERTGMLDGPGSYSFVHKSIGEFLFAQTVKDGHLKTIDGESLNSMWLFRKRNEDRWRGVLYFWAGLTAIKDLQAFIELLGEQSPIRDLLLQIAMLDDQFDRLPAAWLKEKVLRFKGVTIAPPEELEDVVELSVGPADQSLSFRGRAWVPELPALGNKRLHLVMKELVVACKIDPDEFVDASIILQSALWTGIFISIYRGGFMIPALDSKLKVMGENEFRERLVLKASFSAGLRGRGVAGSFDELQNAIAIKPQLKPWAALLWGLAIREENYGRETNGMARKDVLVAAAKFVQFLKDLPVDVQQLSPRSKATSSRYESMRDVFISVARLCEDSSRQSSGDDKVSIKIVQDFIEGLLAKSTPGK